MKFRHNISYIDIAPAQNQLGRGGFSTISCIYIVNISSSGELLIHHESKAMVHESKARGYGFVNYHKDSVVV